LLETNFEKPGTIRKRSSQASRKGRLTVLAVGGACALAAASIYGAAKSGANLAEAIKPSESPGVPVTAVSATQGDIPVFVGGLGTVQAFNTVTVKPRVSGQILDLAFVEGQELQQGAIVAHIDPRPYAAALRQAQGNTAKDEAQLANAKLDLARSVNLAQKGFATTQTLDTQNAQVASLEAAVEADKAAVESAQTQFDYTTIVSAVTGVAGIRMVDAGNVITPSDPGIVVITQLQPITVIFSLPEDAIRTLPVGLPGKSIAVDALARDNTTVLARGTLSLVDNRIDSATGMARLKATFSNDDRALKPGQFVNARLQLETFAGAITLPTAAVQMDQQGSYVYVVGADGTAEQRRIRVARSASGVAVIAEGLRAGEQVVLDGQYRVKPGSRVTVQPAPQNPDNHVTASLPGLP
jgi:membrane fusion protein, multidrug efflux system